MTVDLTLYVALPVNSALTTGNMTQVHPFDDVEVSTNPAAQPEPAAVGA